jgi:hypothetical protein
MNVLLGKVAMPYGILPEHDPHFDLSGFNQIKETAHQVDIFFRVSLVTRNFRPLYFSIEMKLSLLGLQSGPDFFEMGGLN